MEHPSPWQTCRALWILRCTILVTHFVGALVDVDAVFLVTTSSLMVEPPFCLPSLWDPFFLRAERERKVARRERRLCSFHLEELPSSLSPSPLLYLCVIVCICIIVHVYLYNQTHVHTHTHTLRICIFIHIFPYLSQSIFFSFQFWTFMINSSSIWFSVWPSRNIINWGIFHLENASPVFHFYSRNLNISFSAHFRDLSEFYNAFCYRTQM